jgi:hypothetical protein
MRVVVLNISGDKRVAVIKMMREVYRSIGLKEAKEAVTDCGMFIELPNEQGGYSSDELRRRLQLEGLDCRIEDQDDMKSFRKALWLALYTARLYMISGIINGTFTDVCQQMGALEDTDRPDEVI